MHSKFPFFKQYGKILSFCIASIVGVLSFLPAQQSDFGSASGVEGALIGILYDLKQNQRGQPSDVRGRKFRDVLGEFLASDWDESVLNRYFRVSRPVYATRIFIPIMRAEQAPASFGVADVVEPRLWAVHYKGQVAAPMDGVYRLAGYADDFIAARINSKTVLVHGRPDCIPQNFEWEPSARSYGIRVGNGMVRYGQWISLKRGEVIDLDVLVAERPGGAFGAWLFIQREGESYPERRGRPILPIFQLSGGAVETTANSGNRSSGRRGVQVNSQPRESSVWKGVR